MIFLFCVFEFCGVVCVDNVKHFDVKLGEYGVDECFQRVKDL